MRKKPSSLWEDTMKELENKGQKKRKKEKKKEMGRQQRGGKKEREWSEEEN